jgi:hypothetical protein
MTGQPLAHSCRALPGHRRPTCRCGASRLMTGCHEAATSSRPASSTASGRPRHPRPATVPGCSLAEPKPPVGSTFPAGAQNSRLCTGSCHRSQVSAAVHIGGDARPQHTTDVTLGNKLLIEIAGSSRSGFRLAHRAALLRQVSALDAQADYRRRPACARRQMRMAGQSAELRAAEALRREFVARQ